MVISIVQRRDALDQGASRIYEVGTRNAHMSSFIKGRICV